ncbi:hypothetical protein HNP46_004331 [Pseudomonas nitritireducens]|uniref:Uncharacterized protein n=1 Tax=Pseudomonas nitroreducens TaxID=46680 RepID=A0A7W7KMA5_PSENT|nr:hypothetical protein [Pseudomonas nitritireducens]MBB4865450.1 hypothetical protein [Pseudomonas nitritireducens]
MSEFAEKLKAFLATAKDVDGLRVVDGSELYDLVSKVFDYRLVRGLGLDLLIELIDDPEVDWAVEIQRSNQINMSLLAYLLGQVWSETKIPESPGLFEALNRRFSLPDQIAYLKRGEAMPLSPRAGFDMREALTGRLAMHALQSPAHMDAWVDDLACAWRAKRLRHLDGCLEMEGPVAIKQTVMDATTGDGLFRSTHRVLGLASVANTAMWRKSMERYASGTIYEFASGKVYHEHDVFFVGSLPTTVAFALGVLSGEALDALVRDEIGLRPVEQGHYEFCGHLLGSVPYWGAEHIPVEDMLDVKGSTFDDAALRFMFRAEPHCLKPDWFEQLLNNPVAQPLKSRMLDAETFMLWVETMKEPMAKGSAKRFKHLHAWVMNMPVDEYLRTRDWMLGEAEEGLNSRSKHTNYGLVLTKMLVGAFPEEDAVRDFTEENAKKFVRRSLIDRDMTLLAHLLGQGYVTVQEVTRHLKSSEEIQKLANGMKLPIEMILPYCSESLQTGAMIDVLEI